MNMQREIDELNAVPLPPGFVARAATIADAETVTAVLNAAAVAVDGVEQFSVTECLQEWQTPGFNVATSSCLVWHEADQQPAGYIEVWDNRDPPTRIELFGATHPDYWARGVGSFLLAWGEARAHRAVARVPDGVQVTALCAVNGEHELSKALMEGSGLTLSRAAYRMVIDLHSDMVGPKTRPCRPATN
jgi:GNAT superfamily N-acetyltransferase